MSNINSNISNALDTLNTDILGLLSVMKAKDLRAEIKGALSRKANGSSATRVLSEPEMRAEVERIKSRPQTRPAPEPTTVEPFRALVSEASDDNDTEICEVPEAVPTPLPTGDGFVITLGSKPGFVEIRFADKPEDSVRTALKKAGFRFTHKVFENGRVAKGKRDPRWYGKAARIPEMFKSALKRAA